ncbi:MAG TPA: MarR family winged helix-turn-helix transcriptional regulator [Mycobacterium sp.]|nr:MarR family winged helix-turn-helix transcriptional regulator [Mycobacterium sp.]
MARTPRTRQRTAVDAWLLTDIVTRLRRVLRASIRSDYPWEALPMAQVEILQRLGDEPGLRINDLATRHRLANNTVSVLVQQMVVADLITRTTDPADRRAVRLNLTDGGRQMLTEWQGAHERRLESALDRLDSADRSAVLAALPALSRLVDELETAERGSTSEPG